MIYAKTNVNYPLPFSIIIAPTLFLIKIQDTLSLPRDKIYSRPRRHIVRTYKGVVCDVSHKYLSSSGYASVRHLEVQDFVNSEKNGHHLLTSDLKTLCLNCANIIMHPTILLHPKQHTPQIHQGHVQFISWMEKQPMCRFEDFRDEQNKKKLPSNFQPTQLHQKGARKTSHPRNQPRMI